MKQISLANSGFELVTKRTRKREFLDEMNLVVPWTELIGQIEPHAPAGKTGRPPFAVNAASRSAGMSVPALCRPSPVFISLASLGEHIIKCSSGYSPTRIRRCAAMTKFCRCPEEFAERSPCERPANTDAFDAEV